MYHFTKLHIKFSLKHWTKTEVDYKKEFKHYQIISHQNAYMYNRKKFDWFEKFPLHCDLGTNV